MQLASNAVTGQVINDIEPVLTGFLLNRLADDVERLSAFGGAHRLRQRGAGGIEHFFHFGNLPGENHRSARICEVTVHLGRDVDVDQLACLQNMVAGDAVRNDR